MNATVHTKSHATGMAGEFFVMERLFRLGVLPAITLGNAKAVDILVRSGKGKNYAVSVKSVRQGSGKWPIGWDDYAEHPDLVFVFLLYSAFEDVETSPRAWIMPAADAERLKLPWRGQGYAIYYQSQENMRQLAPYEGAWDIFRP